MSLSTLRYSTLIHEENQCWYNASTNRRYYQLKDLNLKFVIGSLIHFTSFPLREGDCDMSGIEPDRESWRSWKVDTDEMWRDYTWSHGWLEDADGNIYDYIFKGGHAGLLIEGVSKQELKSKNIHYYPASQDLQKNILERLIKSITNKINKCEPEDKKWRIEMMKRPNEAFAVLQPNGELMPLEKSLMLSSLNKIKQKNLIAVC